jgi:hypothetical protein
MNTSGIYIEIDPKIKRETEKIAKTLGINLELIVNAGLIEFSKARKSDLDKNGELSDRLINKMLQRLDMMIKTKKPTS